MSQPMTIRDAWHTGIKQCAASPTPRLDARLLLEHVLKVPHSYLIAHDDAILTPAQATQYEAMLQRASQQEPIPYILGRAPFYGRDFAVTPATLIPRPETEELVAQTVAKANTHDAPQIIDVGTGSGCIAVTVARLAPHARITAVDISADALAIATQNATTHGVASRIEFIQSDLLAQTDVTPDIIVANLPYITDNEWTKLDDGVKLHEPAQALRGGHDGLIYIQTLLQQAQSRLSPTGCILLEIGWQQGDATRKLGKTYFPQAAVTVHRDYAGHERIVCIDLCARDSTQRSEMWMSNRQDKQNTPLWLPADAPDTATQVGNLLQTGALVAFPTDTVYGVGASPWDATAVAALYTAKQRPLNKGLPVLIADLDDLDKVAKHIPSAARDALAKYWPGALTIIVPKQDTFAPNLTPNDGVAVRLPDCDTARACIRAAGGVVATSSANLASEPPAQNAEQAFNALKKHIAAVVDGGTTPGGVASTIVSYLNDTPTLLRRGPIPADALGL